jgi:hypothetical protein
MLVILVLTLGDPVGAAVLRNTPPTWGVRRGPCATPTDAHAAPVSGTRILRGPAAKAHLGEVWRSHPDMKAALARSEQTLRARGYHPTREVVLYVVTPEGPRERPIDFKTAQDAWASDGTFEIAAYSWDDGSNSTWEGEVRVYDWTTGAWGVYDHQYDVNWPGTIYWQSTAYYTRPFRQIRGNAVDGGTLRLAANTRALRQYPDWRGYYGCAAAGCVGTVAGCAVVAIATGGSTFAPCFFGGCTGSLVRCAFGNIFAWS